MRKKVGEAAASAEDVENSSVTVGAEEASASRNRQSWAVLIKRVYEVAPCRVRAALQTTLCG